MIVSARKKVEGTLTIVVLDCIRWDGLSRE